MRIIETLNRLKFGREVVYAIFLDIILVVLFGFVSSAFLNKMNQFIQAIGIVAVSAKGLRSSTVPSFGSIFFNSETKGYILMFVLLAIALILFLWFIFSYLFGLSTYLYLNIGKYKTNGAVRFVKRFFVKNIAWFIILAVYEVITFYYFFLDTARPKLGLEKTGFPLTNIIIAVFLVYFWLVSINSRTFKDSIWTGIKWFFPLFFVFIALLGCLVLMGAISGLLVGISRMIATLFEAFVVIGFIGYSRLFFREYNNQVVGK